MKIFKNIVLTLLSSLFLILSFYPFKMGALIFVALIPILIVYRGNKSLPVFIYFTLMGFIFYTVHYNWLTMVWNKKIVLLMTLYIGTYFGVWALINKLFKINFLSIRSIIFSSSLFALLEIIRGSLLGGYNGCSFASAIYNFLPFIQISDIGSFYLVSLLIVLINLSIYSFLFEKQSNKMNILILLIFVITGNLIYGTIKIVIYKKPTTTIKVSYVQPAIIQEKKWNSEYLLENLKQLNALSRQIEENSELIVFPETVTPNDYTKFKLTKSVFDKISKERYIIFGNNYYDKNYFSNYEITKKRNSAIMLKNAKIEEIYFKIKPVPFAENSPIAIGKRLNLGKNVERGHNYTLFKTLYGNFSVMICFESIFPEISRNFVKNGAEFLINISNEAWFQKKPTSSELLILSIFRSIETRRDFLKVSNAGISAYVNSYGKIVKETNLFEEKTSTIDMNKRSGKTFFVEVGYSAIYVLFTISFVITVFQRKKKIYYL